jgi:hypothetical protein
MKPLSLPVSVLLSLAFHLPLSAQTGGGHEFYPLHVGDAWSYQSSARGVFVNEIVDMADVEGTTQYRVRSTDASGRTHHYRIRVHEGRVFHTPPSADEHLFLDFTVPPGGSFDVPRGQAAGTVTYRAFHDKIALGGSVYRHVREYHHADAGFSSFYARGIGLVGMTWSEGGAAVHLLHADVGGRVLVDRSVEEAGP